jgi:alpha-L-arabinofuranosidase
MKLTIEPDNKKEELGDLYGIFFEDINHAADGGLYAEMVQNRSFEYDVIDNQDYNHLTAWEKIENSGTVRLVVETGNPVSHKNPHYLGMDIIFPGKDVGVMNLGYNSGFTFRKNVKYYFTCYARREQDFDKPIKVSFRSKDGNIYSENEILITDNWQKYELEIGSQVNDYSGRLAITADGRGKVYLDFVSLFPEDTYKNRRNGMRADIAKLLEDMHPKFMRFPGGCLVHDGSLDSDARDSQYRWKNSIGELTKRSSRKNNWCYNQSLGLGYYEYFQFCEDIGAKPLPVLPAGYDPHHHREIPMDKLIPWIEDALDLIEFANGGTDTKWGAKRAELGHIKPFNLEYIGIGNEEVGEAFPERYKAICSAVKEKYPDIKVIGTSGPFAAGSEFERGWKCARESKTSLVDEHYYMAPEWFIANHHRYDSYDMKAPKVFLGEYASWGNTWYNALIEASYMIGLERNAGTVGLACYAPMLCNVDYINWKPDMIWFDNHRAYGSANYYVQKLFMNNLGNRLVNIEATELPDISDENKFTNKISGKIRLSGIESDVSYSNITIINDDTGEVISFPDCNLKNGDIKELTEIDYDNYTLSLKAVENEGLKGFNIDFGYNDNDNHFLWLLGGWQNQDTAVTERIVGRNAELSQCQFSVERGREYNLKLAVRGRHVNTDIDDKLIHATESKPPIKEPLYYTASVVCNNDKEDEIILKTVNLRDKPQNAKIEIKGSNVEKIKVYQMNGWDLSAVNDFDNPTIVSPKEWTLEVNDNHLKFEFPKESITVFRMKLKRASM